MAVGQSGLLTEAGGCCGWEQPSREGSKVLLCPGCGSADASAGFVPLLVSTGRPTCLDGKGPRAAPALP